MKQTDYTDFGFETVTSTDKRKRVSSLFDSVAPGYDLMNDLMSLGIHRLWKRYAVELAGIRPGNQVLDVAGGTGDLTRLMQPKAGESGRITVCDISHNMIARGRDRLLDEGILRGVDFIQGDAENLPFKNNSFHLITVAFGLRNVTDKVAALASMFSKLRFGGKLLVLEFSKVSAPLLRDVYGIYAKNCIPLLGKLIAGDEASYRYLVESIEMHPGQDELSTMLKEAGFTRVTYQNLSGGIVAIHTGYKL